MFTFYVYEIAGLLRDHEDEQFVDRIKAVAWKEARDNGANFINKKWIAKTIELVLSEMENSSSLYEKLLLTYPH